MTKARVTEDSLRRLLREKHSKDVFVEECKDGSTWFRGHRRLDAWALKRSWSPVTMTGYEIKVSRRDFLGDDKWPAYLPLCNQLYFVCPPGLIDPAELPESVGLLWAATTGSRLYTKRKAPFREVEPPVDLFLYLLMSRMRVAHGLYANEQPGNREYWRTWLEDRRADQDVGHRVAYRISEAINRAKADKYRAEKVVEKYKDFEDKLRAVGIDPEASDWQMERKLRELTEVPVPDLLEDKLEVVQRNLRELQQTIRRAKSRGGIRV